MQPGMKRLKRVLYIYAHPNLGRVSSHIRNHNNIRCCTFNQEATLAISFVSGKLSQVSFAARSEDTPINVAELELPLLSCG